LRKTPNRGRKKKKNAFRKRKKKGEAVENPKNLLMSHLGERGEGKKKKKKKEGRTCPALGFKASSAFCSQEKRYEKGEEST